MKFECTKDRFIKAFSKIEKISSKGSSNPILKCVLIEGDKSSITLKATNLDIGIEVFLPAKMDEPGSVAVKASVLGSFISQSEKEKSFKFEKKGDVLNVYSENFSSSLKLNKTEDFPLIPKNSDTNKFSISSKDLVKGLKSVSYSAAVSSIKPELASVFIYPEDDNLVFVATDSFRLAEKKIKIKTKPEFDQILIPFKNISDIARILEEKDENIEICVDKNQISFSSDDYYLISRTIEGTFPSYKQIIPKSSSTEVVVLKQDFLGALKVAHVFSDQFNRITLKIDPTTKKLEITTKNNDIGENLSQLSGAITGLPIEISFNYKNIHDSFQSIDSDSVSLSFDGINKPMIIKGVGDKSFFYLAMPMNK